VFQRSETMDRFSRLASCRLVGGWATAISSAGGNAVGSPRLDDSLSRSSRRQGAPKSKRAAFVTAPTDSSGAVAGSRVVTAFTDRGIRILARHAAQCVR
jgi:hypothetical protein